ncbi:calcium/sodium antiporter [Persicobacter sp. CCB-QB2]|uniref:calcium/sodium antiporter n=1 Tax=Persicobacter sp. CCB-QB2 TaxID=1561025 RepID=UPI0020A17EC5|nr:calcium/sodium antiporter [Persicobacter sp. CCB-QB2]
MMESMIFDIARLVLGLLFLIGGGNYLVKGGTELALRYRISPMVVGLTVIAFGTSAPELLVSVTAAFQGSPDLAMGNVVGSNICNLALVLGTTVVITPIVVQKSTLKVDWPATFGASVLLVLLVQGGVLTALEGALLFGTLIIYLTYQVWKSKKNPHIPEEVAEVMEAGIKGTVWKDILWMALGGLGLYFGSDWFVEGAQNIAKAFSVPERVIGLTVVALGTSLPELATSVIAARKNQVDMALGNLLGSNIFNILSILGITAMISPISVNASFIDNDMYWMLGVTAIIFPMMWIGKKVGRIDGLILLAVYFLYTYLVLAN